MSQSLLSRPRLGSVKPSRASFRPQLEGLEERVVMASPGSLALPIEVADVNLVGDQLQATFSIAGQLVTDAAGNAVTSVLGALASIEDGVPVLNLSLGPVDLNLLGLGVSLDNCADGPVTVDVTAHPGQGILGDLLGGLAGGLDLGGILSRLDTLGADLDQFLDQIDNLLDQVLGTSMQVTEIFGSPVGGGAGAASHADGVCDILNLELQSINLNLLGLQVETSDICLDVTATEGEGILGDLLCGIAGGDGIDLGGINLNRLIGQIDRLIDRVGDILEGVEDVTDLDDRTVARLERVFDQFERALDRLIDRTDDLRGLQRVIERLDRVIDRLDALSNAVDQLRDLLEQLGGASAAKGKK